MQRPSDASRPAARGCPAAKVQFEKEENLSKRNKESMMGLGGLTAFFALNRPKSERRCLPKCDSKFRTCDFRKHFNTQRGCNTLSDGVSVSALSRNDSSGPHCLNSGTVTRVRMYLRSKTISEDERHNCVDIRFKLCLAFLNQDRRCRAKIPGKENLTHHLVKVCTNCDYDCHTGNISHA